MYLTIPSCGLEFVIKKAGSLEEGEGPLLFFSKPNFSFEENGHITYLLLCRYASYHLILSLV